MIIYSINIKNNFYKSNFVKVIDNFLKKFKLDNYTKSF